MATKQKIKQKHSHKRALLFGGLGLLLVMVLSVQAAATTYLWKHAEEQSTIKIQLLLESSIRPLMREPVLEPKEGKLYLPEARLTVPYDPEAPPIFYFADKTSARVGESWKTNALISRMQNARTLDETYRIVPDIQACTRAVTLQYAGDDAEGGVAAFSKTLADGRKLVAYTEPKCPVDLDKLVARLKQVESY